MFHMPEKTLRTGRMDRSLRAVLIVSTACTALAAAAAAAEPATAPAGAVALSQTAATDFKIPPQSLDSALTAFADQAGLRLLFSAPDMAGIRSAGLTGRFTPGDALSRLLAGTGFIGRFTDAHTVTVSKVADADGAMLLDPVTVEGASASGADGETAWSPTQGYVAKRSASGTKTDTPIIETPQAISVVTREQIDDQGSKTVMQAMRYTPGAFTGQVGASNRYDYVILRGLVDRSIDNVYLDGLKMMGDDSTYSSMQIDPYFLERIDAVKGPSSVLYGRSSPGGLIALTSKKPLFESYHQMEVNYGSRNQRGVGFDLAGPLDEGGHLAYRLVGLADASDTQFDTAKEERYALAPSLTAKFKDDTTLTVLAYLQKDPEGGTHNGAPAEGTLYAHNGQYISRHFFDGEDGMEKFERTQNMLGYELEHRFNDVWSARQNVRVLDSNVDIDQIYQIGWNGTTNQLNRYYGGGHESLTAVTMDNQAQADFSTGALKHTVLGGLDYQRRRTKNDWTFASVSGIDAFSPVYGSYTLSGAYDSKATRHLEQSGLYLQDQIAWEHWRLSLGGRQDWAQTAIHDRVADTDTGEQYHKFTKRAGLLYLFDNGVAPYVSYAESFNPNLYKDEDGNPLKPTEGTQYETGVKYQPPGTRHMVSAALFTIDQKNVAVMDTATYVYYPVGTIRSRGLELEGNLQVTDEFKLMAGYSFTDASYATSPNGKEGNTPPQVPKHMASLWGDYTFGSGPMRNLSLGAGLRYVGQSWADSANTVHVPSYTLVDVSLRYPLDEIGAKGAEFRLNANNLLDKTYIASCLELTNCYYGEERTIMATMSYKF